MQRWRGAEVKFNGVGGMGIKRTILIFLYLSALMKHPINHGYCSAGVCYSWYGNPMVLF